MEILKDLSQYMQDMSPQKSLETMAARFSGKIVFSNSFGLEDQVIQDMIFSANVPIRVFTLDTGRFFQETYDVMEYSRARYKKEIVPYFPLTESVEKMVKEKGPNSFYLSIDNRKECCYIRKIEPLKRALRNMSVWVTGLRAEQSEHRSGLQKLEWDESNRIIKFHPLLDWTLEQVKEYIKTNNVPYNVLHDQGFPSIGCQPCTRAIQPGEDFRAGRWWWESSHKECGLHK